MTVNRREFACAVLASVGVAMCPCWASEPSPQTKSAHSKSAQKPRPKSLVAVSAVCCGTCQHWKGGRELVEQGRRIRCDAMPASPCYRGAGFKYAATNSAASHGCVGKHYKRWVEL